MIPLPHNLEWTGDALRVLDQRQLPSAEAYLDCRTWASVAEAIRTLAVRGAPAIGLAGGYGVALAARAHPVGGAEFEAAVRELGAARPTALNLGQAVRIVRQAALDGGAAAAPEAALRAALALHAQDARQCARLARLGAELLPSGADPAWVLTYCHTGALSTGGVGTALGAIAAGFRRGSVGGVYACESRPLWQGARLTAWECGRLGIPCRVLADAAAASLLASGRVGLALVGADRIAANGDTANKVGTYALAALCFRHAVPFYVVAPSSTIDAGCPSGQGIPIEERDAREVLTPMAAPGAGAFNPAFDVTPGTLISGIVTELGVLRRPYRLQGLDAGWGGLAGDA